MCLERMDSFCIWNFWDIKEIKIMDEDQFDKIKYFWLMILLWIVGILSTIVLYRDIMRGKW